MPIILIGILGGTLLASALQALFGIGSTIAANKYNSPKSQLNRLRQAGLPQAYMYQGKVATQSEIPKLSIDPHLGTLAKMQGGKVKEDTKISAEIADNLQKENQIKDMMSGIIQPDGTELNNRATKMFAERDQAVAEAFIKKHEQALKKIELDVEEKAFAENVQLETKRQVLQRAAQQIKNLLAQEGLMEQLKGIRGLEEKLNQALTEDLDNMPDWLSTVLKVILIATRRR